MGLAELIELVEEEDAAELLIAQCGQLVPFGQILLDDLVDGNGGHRVGHHLSICINEI